MNSLTNDLMHDLYSRRQELRGQMHHLRIDLEYKARMLTGVPNGEGPKYWDAHTDMLQATELLASAYEEHQLMSETILQLKDKAA